MSLFVHQGQEQWSPIYSEASSFLPPRCSQHTFLSQGCSSSWHWGSGGQLSQNPCWVSDSVPEGDWYKARVELPRTKGD